MNYMIWYDEDEGVLYLKTYTLLTVKEIEEILPLMAEHFKDRSHRYILADMTDNHSGFVDREARRLLKERANQIIFDKMAVIGAGPATRMITKVALNVLGKTDQTRFHKTEKEALAWLKGGS